MSGADRYSFRWGLSFMDSGGNYIPGFILRNYTIAGIQRLELLTVIHVSAYHWESSESEGARPSLRTIADQMGYARRADVRRHLRRLAARTWTPTTPTQTPTPTPHPTTTGRGSGGGAGKAAIAMLEIIERAGRPSQYIAHGLARACIEIELARTMSMRNRGGEEALLEDLRAKIETSPESGGSIDWTLVQTPAEEGGALPRDKGTQAEDLPAIAGTQAARPPLDSRAEEKELFLMNVLKEEEKNLVSPSNGKPEDEDRETPEVWTRFLRAWSYAVNQIEIQGIEARLKIQQLTLKDIDPTTATFEIEAPSEALLNWALRMRPYLISYTTAALDESSSFVFTTPELMEE